MIRKMMLVLAVLMCLSLASCAAPEPKAEDATEAVCKNLVLFNNSVDELKAENSSSDLKALQAQFSVVRTNFNNLVQSAANLNQAEKDDFLTATEELLEVASSLPEDVSVTEALQELADPIAQVRQAAENLKTSLECK